MSIVERRRRALITAVARLLNASDATAKRVALSKLWDELGHSELKADELTAILEPQLRLFT